MTHRLFAIAVLSADLLGGCVTPQSGTPNPYPPVPPPMAEAIPKPPVNQLSLMWQPGHWDWNGRGYYWSPGEYVPAAGHGQLFQPGYWVETTSGWVWLRAHWTS